jgi:hypothetical protein
VQLEFRTGHDDRTAGIVDALAEQVLAEAALLALEHVGERLQRTLVGARDDAAAAAVVEQRVDGLLQHALLVADDDVRRAQLDQPLEAVVAVDDAAVEIVEIGRREAAAIERHQRAQVRRDDRDDLHDHPFGTVARLDEVLDDLEALESFFCFSSEVVRPDLAQRRSPAIFSRSRRPGSADRLGADHGGEGCPRRTRPDGHHVLFLGQELVLLERGEAGSVTM